MRKIKAEFIGKELQSLVLKANTELRPDVLRLLKQAEKNEKNRLARKAIAAILENAQAAKKEKIAICQDTGLPVAFIWIGEQVFIEGNITRAVTETIAKAYRKGFFRASIQRDPLFRKFSPSTFPAIVHTEIVPGDRIKIVLLPKGFGSENKAGVKMFNPTAELFEIEDFIVEQVRKAGSGACPPYVLGIGIGGTQDFACLLAKKALLGSLVKKNPDKKLAAMEKRLLEKVNSLKIGAFGLNGTHTALSVRVLTHPTHIAGLPVAVNISCHALRSAEIII